MKLAWGAKVDKAFIEKVFEICDKFEWPDTHPSWLMACMAFESGETFSPSIKNAAGSGATGLIQIMPFNMETYGYTPEQVENMTAVEQLDKIVLRYFKPYAHKIRTLSDMYMAILAPKHIGKPEGTVLYSEGLAYRLNAPLDINSDGKITKKEATLFVERKLLKGLGFGYYAQIDRAIQNEDPMRLITEIEDKLRLLKEIV